jgi:DUF1009 family protein
MSTPSDRIGILAGGGRLPLMIAESAAARGHSVHIVGIEGEADPSIAGYPHTWVNWGQVGRMVSALRGQGGDLVIAGGVTRPDLWRVRPDAGFFANLPQIAALLAGGDDAVLTRVVRFFEAKGLRVRGAHEVAPDLLAHAGQMGQVALSAQSHRDATIGFAVRRLLGPLDAGQAVVVADGKVLAIEGAEGTDAMLQRVAHLGHPHGRTGVLAKGPKPGQELRVDMPAIGPSTVAGTVEAGLAGIALEAGSVLVLDRPETVRAADAAACALLALAVPSAAPAEPPFSRSKHHIGALVGRLRPNARATRDIAKGLAAVERLAPLATGGAVVVARDYILAIEAGEGIRALLERVRGLRQWGERRRRLGALVCRAERLAGDGMTPATLLHSAAAQGLAAVAVLGTPDMLHELADAAKSADAAGIALVTCASATG